MIADDLQSAGIEVSWTANEFRDSFLQVTRVRLQGKSPNGGSSIFTHDKDAGDRKTNVSKSSSASTETKERTDQEAYKNCDYLCSSS